MRSRPRGAFRPDQRGLDQTDPRLNQIGPALKTPTDSIGANTALATTPIPQNGTVTPRPVSSAQRRSHEYLTSKGIERLIATAR